MLDERNCFQESVGDSLEPILANVDLFGLNLYDVGMGAKITGFFQEMLSGKNAVRATLKKYLGDTWKKDIRS